MEIVPGFHLPISPSVSDILQRMFFASKDWKNVSSPPSPAKRLISMFPCIRLKPRISTSLAAIAVWSELLKPAMNLRDSVRFTRKTQLAATSIKKKIKIRNPNLRK